MNRHALLVMMLLLAAGVVTADNASEADRAPRAGAVPAPASTRLAATTETISEERPEAEPETKSTTDEKPKADNGAKVISGMSILGNREAPKALVIVPWKSSEIRKSPGISATLDDGRQPVDPEVFLRALRYYEIKVEGHAGGTGTDDKIDGN